MPNTALNRTTQILLTNKSGGNLNYGDVVVLDNTNANGFTTTTTAGLSTRGLGVILEPNGIANNASGMVAVGGWCPKVNLNTAAAVGQFIKTHTVAGQGTPHASPQAEGDFGVALSASATPACNLFGSPNGPVSGGAGTVTNTGTLTAAQPVVGNGSADIKVSALFVNSIVNGRLTTESGVPISTSDRSAQATIYFTPYYGSQIALYTGSVWVILTFSQISLALSGLTSGKNYDVFVDYNSGTPQLVLSAAWASDTTRTDALALQDGVTVKSGTTTYRWVGTIRTTGTTTTEDSKAKRFVWNAYNQVPRLMLVNETTDTWVYSTATFRQANAAAANQLDYVAGDAAAYLQVDVHMNVGSNGSVDIAVGVGVDSTTTNTAFQFGNTAGSGGIGVATHAVYKGYPGLGRHTLVWLEKGGGSGTTTWYGDNGGVYSNGIWGTVLG